jgi:hypothetical protein
MFNFESVWKKLDGLVREGRVGAPAIVLKELEYQDDEVTAWAKERPDLFFDESSYQIEKVKDILSNFNGLIRAAYGREQADPFVIAMAHERKYGPQKDLFQHEVCVVTQEQLHGKREKIPLVCKYYGLNYLSVVDMIKNENWKF